MSRLEFLDKRDMRLVSDEDYLGMKTHALEIKGEIYRRAPEIAGQGFDYLLTNLCQQMACHRFEHGGMDFAPALDFGQKSCDTLAETYAAKALQARDGQAVAFYHKTEAGLRSISHVLGDMAREQLSVEPVTIAP